MTQVSVGPPLSPEQESNLRRGQRQTALAEAEKAADTIREKIAGMQGALRVRLDEIAQLRTELEG